MSPEENCVEIAKCNYVPPLITAEWVLALDLLLLVAVSTPDNAAFSEATRSAF